jgi:hypothetical protein
VKNDLCLSKLAEIVKARGWEAPRKGVNIAVGSRDLLSHSSVPIDDRDTVDQNGSIEGG